MPIEESLLALWPGSRVDELQKFTSSSAPPNSLPLFNPQLCRRIPSAASLPQVLPAPMAPTDLPPTHCFIPASQPLQQVLLGNTHVTPAREAGRLTADLHFPSLSLPSSPITQSYPSLCSTPPIDSPCGRKLIKQFMIWKWKQNQ